jgi:RHS repeat-associated protein
MSEGGTAYGWNDNGNLMSKAGDASYEWDFEDRLVKVVKGDGTVVENVYDVDGVMVRTVVNGAATDLLVDTSGGLSHVVAEIDGAGAVTALYVHAGDMLLEEIRGGVAKTYEADGLGSVRSLLDTTGARTDTWNYEAFGSTVSSTGTDANPYRFAGERLIEAAGMYQNRARWLDTGVGRFVSVDRAPGTRSRPMTQLAYSYAESSPINKLDPSGNFSDLSSLMGAMAVSGILSSIGCQPSPALKGGLGTRAVPPTGREILLKSSEVRGAMERAWEESMADDPVLRHEEGGWIYIHPETRIIVTVREWRSQYVGVQVAGHRSIDLWHPPILDMFYIVADFHTHPNPPPDPQGPSPDDDDIARQVGVPGLILSWSGYRITNGTNRRENYNGSFGYPLIVGGRK